MQYYELQNPHDLQLMEFELKASAPSEIVAKTLYSIISPGTETAAYVGAPPLRPMKVYPRLLGYCNIAKVLKTGSSVVDVATGDIILTFQSHRSHFSCTAEQIIAKIDSTVDLKAAASTYLYHLGYSALLAGHIQPGLNVAVIGWGTLGVTTTSLSTLFGCKTFVYTNQLNHQGLKNDQYFFSKIVNAEEIERLTYGTGIDIVINTSNNWDDWRLALELVRKKGTIVNLGFPGRGTDLPSFNPLDSRYCYEKEITIKYNESVPEKDLLPHEARFTLKRNMQYLLDLIQQGKIDPYEIISDEIRWDQLETAYKRMLQKKETFFTAVLDWTTYV